MANRTVLITVFLASILILITACIPFPHRELRSPLLKGKVLDAGSPVEGATVMFSTGYTDEVAVAITDANGQFAVGPLKEFRLVKALIVYPHYMYKVLFKINGKIYVGYSISSAGLVDEEISLFCDMSRPIEQIGREGGRFNTYCYKSVL